MIENLPVKIDEVGRIVIPQKVRKRYGIEKDCFLLLTLEEKSILLTKQNDETELNKLFLKIRKIEKFYNFDIILTNEEKILYTSNGCKTLMKEKFSCEVKKIFEEEQYDVNLNLTNFFSISFPYYYSLIRVDNYTKYLFIVIYKDIELRKIAYLICNLLV